MLKPVLIAVLMVSLMAVLMVVLMAVLMGVLMAVLIAVLTAVLITILSQQFSSSYSGNGRNKWPNPALLKSNWRNVVRNRVNPAMTRGETSLSSGSKAGSKIF